MPKSLRVFALVVALSLTATPFVHAERFGTNPHPQPTNPVPVKASVIQTLAYTVLIYLGV